MSTMSPLPDPNRRHPAPHPFWFTVQGWREFRLLRPIALSIVGMLMVILAPTGDAQWQET